MVGRYMENMFKHPQHIYLYGGVKGVTNVKSDWDHTAWPAVVIPLLSALALHLPWMVSTIEWPDLKSPDRWFAIGASSRGIYIFVLQRKKSIGPNLQILWIEFGWIESDDNDSLWLHSCRWRAVSKLLGYNLPICLPRVVVNIFTKLPSTPDPTSVSRHPKFLRSLRKEIKILLKWFVTV